VSIGVDLEALTEHIGEFGGAAFLVTVGDDLRPHVVSVQVRAEGDALVLSAGRRTSANVEVRPGVTLVWPAGPGGDYSLIVDGTAEKPTGDGGAISVSPSSAVLHRAADATGQGPGCVPVTVAASETPAGTAP
jgi:hypothetical protein